LIPDPSGATAADGLRVELSHTNQQIAARVGSVREVVSRALTRLRHDGLIRLEGRRLTVPDEKALASFAGEEEQ
jgi:CRP-like cAMP-binding protein